MFKFLRDAKSEIEHVVWPTPKETKKYMYYNIAVIVVVSVFLMILGYILQGTLSSTRELFPHDAIVLPTDTVTQSELDDITEAIEKKAQADALNTPSDATASPDADITDDSVDSTGAIVQ